MSTFGDFIKKEREKKEMTQDKLSKVLDIPYTDVSKIERGKKKFKFEKLTRLAEIFKVDLQKVKDLYGADIMIEQKVKYQCSEAVFSVAESQSKYINEKNVKQGKMKF